MPGPLEGFKVVDLSAVVSGPLTATLLADQGADDAWLAWAASAR